MAWVAFWLLILFQPWLDWPHLLPVVSHRLTLVVCGLLLGLGQIGSTRRVSALPWRWLVVALGVGVVLFAHTGASVLDGGYLDHFQETALLSDGLLLLLAVVWGAWGLLQVPMRWFDQLPTVGTWLVLVNCGVALWQRGQSGEGVGLLGLDRYAGAYALCWLPIVWTTRRWVGVLAALCWLLLAGKLFPLVVACGVLGWLWASRWRWSALAVLPLAVIVHQGAWGLQVVQRAETWRNGLTASIARPLLGWGFSPLAWAMLPESYGYHLPSAHSDWIALVFHGGWLLLGVIGWGLWGTLRDRPRTPLARGLRISLLASAVLACVQDVVSDARIGGLCLVFLVWWVREQTESANAGAVGASAWRVSRVGVDRVGGPPV